MCTAVSYKTGSHYFGRNLDIEKSYGEKVTVTPRNYIFNMRCVPSLIKHYSMIGMALTVDDYPLYFEATNEKGLSAAGLNFPDNAYYNDLDESKENITPFEFIPYILGKCENVREAKSLLEKINIVNIPFSEKLPLSPLHWLISDRDTSITVESVKEGLKVYENPFGVLTNNPTFDYHRMNVNNYRHLHEGAGENRLSAGQELDNYSLGMGALGLPGDFSSASRFVRAVFVKEKSVSDDSEKESVCQFFHILSSVAMPKGCVLTKNGEYEYTMYSCCCNTDKGIFYYKTYYDSRVKFVDMHDADLEGKEIYVFEQ